MSKNKTKSSKPKTDETLVYCGPSLKDVKQYDVFSGELPAYIQEHFKEPAVKALFVDITDLAQTRKNIRKQGSRENQLYLRSLEYAKGGSN
ncbi:hypothetical protein [Virgibacillus halodenitrificans]|uniref:hypothetical protein n=1 Tax=Virgibacillus halodenitrificans TaxID=1482 RepID=UPI000EF4675C|nr:hypothetical protein [Virgibacillus halodenitrificans]